MAKRRKKIPLCPYCQLRTGLTIEGHKHALTAINRAPTLFVLCRQCGATGPYGGTENEAIAEWGKVRPK